MLRRCRISLAWDVVSAFWVLDFRDVAEAHDRALILSDQWQQQQQLKNTTQRLLQAPAAVQILALFEPPPPFVGHVQAPHSSHLHRLCRTRRSIDTTTLQRSRLPAVPDFATVLHRVAPRSTLCACFRAGLRHFRTFHPQRSKCACCNRQIPRPNNDHPWRFQ